MLLHRRNIDELNVALELYAVGNWLGVETELSTLRLVTCANHFGNLQAFDHFLAGMG